MRSGTAIALNSLCWMDLSPDLDVIPTETFEEAMAASQRIGSMVEVAISTGNYGWRLAREDRAKGVNLLRRAFVMLVGCDMAAGVSYMADGLAEVLTLEGEDEQAALMFGFTDALVNVMGPLSTLATSQPQGPLDRGDH